MIVGFRNANAYPAAPERKKKADFPELTLARASAVHAARKLETLRQRERRLQTSRTRGNGVAVAKFGKHRPVSATQVKSARTPLDADVQIVEIALTELA